MLVVILGAPSAFRANDSHSYFSSAAHSSLDVSMPHHTLQEQFVFAANGRSKQYVALPCSCPQLTPLPSGVAVLVA